MPGQSLVGVDSHKSQTVDARAIGGSIIDLGIADNEYFSLGDFHRIGLCHQVHV